MMIYDISEKIWALHIIFDKRNVKTYYLTFKNISAFKLHYKHIIRATYICIIIYK